MRRRNTIVAAALAAALALGGAQMHIVAEADGLETGGAPAAETPQKKKGSGFANALAAPFRAIGRIFGGGKGEKKVSRGLQRITEKDAAAFEVSPVMRAGAVEPAARAESAGPAAGAPAEPGYAAQQNVLQARQLLASGRVAEAIALLSSAAALAPDLAEAHHLLAYSYHRKGQHQLSFNHYRRALKLAPRDAQLLNDYGHTLYLRGQYKEAKDALKKAVKLAPGEERMWNNLAMAQCALGKYDDAYKSFVRAGGELKAHMNVGSMLESVGQVEDALKHYESARQLSPDSRKVLQHLADAYQRLGRREEAEAARRAMPDPKRDQPKAENGGK